ncbi:MAG: hypothetical protein GWN81_18060, partial [Phycisphaerae bacterium]|nr:hypothetical protein [Phycisphaerae bacterium]
PKESRDGLPGLADLMRGLQGYFLKNEGDVRKQNDDLLAALRAGPSRHGRSGYSLQVSLLGEAV